MAQRITLDAAKGRVAGKTFPADCFSCARCLNVCPTDTIHYGLVGKKRAAELVFSRLTKEN